MAEEGNGLSNLRDYLKNAELPKSEIQDLLKIASKICKTPVSIVNILDDQYQTTIASVGDWEDKTIPVKNGICHRVVRDGELLVLDNLDHHKDIQQNLTKADQENIKFYAGAPLTTSNGNNIGAVCLIDSKPNQLSESQTESLMIITREVMNKIELTRKSRLLKHYNELLEKTTDLVFMIDPKSQKIVDVNNGFCDILGWKKKEVIGTIINDLIISDYKGNRQLSRWIERYSATEEDFTSNLKIRTPDKSHHWIKCHFSFNEDDQIIVTAIDINHLFNTENEIQQLQKKYEKIIDATSDVIWEYDVASDTYILSKGFTGLLGYELDEVKGRDWWISNIHPEGRLRIMKKLKAFEKAEDEYYWSEFYRFKTKSGEYRFINDNAYVERDSKGRPKFYIGALEDFTEIRKVQKEQERLFSRLSMAGELAHLGYWEVNLKDGSVTWSNEMYKLLEADNDSIKPSIEYLVSLAADEDKIRITGLIKELEISKEGASLQHQITLENGKTKFLFHKGELIINEEDSLLLISTQDVSERMEYERNIEASLREKEVLLAEIHHRVKNNLAVISALLQLEQMSIDENSNVEGILSRSLSRIHSMGKLHEILYQSGTFSNVTIKDYLQEIIDSFYRKLFPGGEIVLSDNSGNMGLNINQAVPTALIVNELITNSIEHAFPVGEQGLIKVNIDVQDGYLFVEVSDNGTGVEDDFDLYDSDSLGMILIKQLCSQLKGDIFFNNEDGFSVTISFRLKEGKGSSSRL